MKRRSEKKPKFADTSGFWRGGRDAYHQGLAEEMQSKLSVLKQQLEAAETEIEKERIRQQMEALEKEYADQGKNTDESLF